MAKSCGHSSTQVHPFYKPRWSATIMGVVLEDGTDWAEIAELIIESYRFCAPQKLARLLDR